MLYEVALLPEVFDSRSLEDGARAEKLKLLLRELSDNGLIADLNRSDWRKYVNRLNEALPPSLRDELTKRLTILHDRRRLVRHPRVSQDAPECLDWRGLASTIDCLFGIIGNEVYEVRSTITSVPIDHVLDSELWERRSRTWKVNQSREGYREILTPLLRYARKILLVDPYLCPNNAYRPIIELCTELLKKGGGQSRVIEFHTSEQSDNDYDLWRQLLEPLHDNYGHDFVVKVYRRPRGGQQFHDRYLLTDQCGVLVAAGFRAMRDSYTDWTLLDYSGANRHRSNFESPSHPFLELMGQPFSIS